MLYKKIMRFSVIVLIVVCLANSIVGFINAIGLVDHPVTNANTTWYIGIIPALAGIVLAAILMAIYKKYLKKNRYHEMDNATFFRLGQLLRKSKEK